MSMTPDEARYEQWLDEIYSEHKEQAIEEFTTDRLQSFYLDHPDIILFPSQALSEGRSLLGISPRAGFIFGAIAIEVSLKKAILQPAVYGLVNSKSTADLITNLAMSHVQIGKFKKLLFHILSEHLDLDLGEFTRLGAEDPLWKEAESIREKRNNVVHEALPVTTDEAQRSIEVGLFILESLIPMLLEKLGLVLGPDLLVKERGKYEIERFMSKPGTQNIA